MARQEPETPLERRLRELEEEERALQQHVKEVARKVRKIEHVAADSGFPRGEPRLASTVPRPGAPETLAAAEAGVDPAPAPRAAPAPGMAPRNPGPRETERFANYFANGSFGKARPMGRERQVMRNKAIFMVVVVALVAFLLYRLVFGS